MTSTTNLTIVQLYLSKAFQVDDGYCVDVRKKSWEYHRGLSPTYISESASRECYYGGYSAIHEPLLDEGPIQLCAIDTIISNSRRKQQTDTGPFYCNVCCE